MSETGGMGVVQQTRDDGGIEYLVSSLVGRLSPPIGNVIAASDLESLMDQGVSVTVRPPSVGDPFRHLRSEE